MRRLVLLSLLLHAAAAATLIALPHARLPQAGEPARIEIIFGANGATPTPPAAAAAPADPAEGGAAAASVMPQRQASADPGLRVERPDPSLIPATDDPGNRGPDYPAGSWLRHEQGTVLIRLHIGPDGVVTRLETLASSGSPALDAAAATALSHWHFLPARRDGQPVASYRDQPVRFVIE